MTSPDRFTLRLATVTPFRDVDGIANAIWTYEISWTDSASWPALFAFRAGLAPRLRLGLELSRRIPIQDPARFPSTTSIQQTNVLLPATGAAQYVFADFDPASDTPGVLSFVAPAQRDDFTAVVLVHQPAVETPWTPLSFTTSAEGDVALRHIVTGPAVVCAAGSGDGLPPGLLPYATELFGTFQPLIGWISQIGGSLFARPTPPSAVTGVSAQLAILSPVGLIDLFREYFFEIDTFLGVPVGHIWISPGGTVELVEVSTRKTTIEQTTEQSVETTNKTESNLTQQDDIADATKEDNQSNTKLGVSATESGGFKPIIEGSASQSFSIDNTIHSSQEQSHKHSRTQSEKVSAEIRRNFKTTFRTVTETTDTTSRRYVVQNTTDKLVNYELRRKMRKIAVQVQHIGTQLCWQAYLDDPGRLLGMGAMVHVATPSAATSAMARPNRWLQRKRSFKAHFPWMPYSTDHAGDYAGADTFYRNSGDRIAERNEFNGPTLERYDADHSDPIKLTGATIYSEYTYTAVVPAPGYRLTGIRIGKADKPVWAVPKILDENRGVFTLHLVNAHPSGDAGLDFDELTLRSGSTGDRPRIDRFQEPAG